MEQRIDLDFEKIFKAVMGVFYDDANYDYYNKKLRIEDKMQVVEHLLNSMTSKYDVNQIDFKNCADDILKRYYEYPIKGNDFIKPISMDSGLFEEESLWINAYDINQVQLLYNKNNIRTIVLLEKSENTFWKVTLLDFVENNELTAKQKYQVYTDVYHMLLEELG